ncbi:MAG: acetyl-CoA carboxylase biotin carboxyl carrier protein subunit [Ferrovibrio sp.]|uniref:biotin/lipoyl-containing protein n=1 Tax=Ferrovibrio sp. TaxID=1917215 RepID=UPI0026224406|nr:biotin/lipoyl-containing protein [Ferrovibrio sp.]MCW0234565.1 acetyl-CoA carboxylase biotin carboxyl carrier protein subunit [Ferrovibrio sp.]
MARHIIKADITGTVFKIETSIGAVVDAGATLVVLESMKMEIPVEAPSAGKVVEIMVVETEAITEGQALVVVEG